jgi:hypothetical protein
MTGAGDGANQVGVPLGHPPEHEEGRARVVSRQQLE